MARVARLIDRAKLSALKERLKDSEYVSFAIQAIAYKLTNQFFEKVKYKKQ